MARFTQTADIQDDDGNGARQNVTDPSVIGDLSIKRTIWIRQCRRGTFRTLTDYQSSSARVHGVAVCNNAIEVGS